MEYNAQQQDAIEAAGNIMILAIAGSGKTAVLCARAARILQQSNTTRIILVTFTKQSGNELTQRIENLVPNCKDRLIVGTFHSISLRYITVMKKLSTNLISPSEQDQLLRRVHQMKCGGSNYEKFTRYVSGHATGLTSLERETFSDSFQFYLQELEKHKRIDFDSLLKTAVQQFKEASTPPFGASHLMVDEFQDIDETQLQWIAEVAQKKVSLTVVGDDDQSIYGFRRSLGYEGFRKLQKIRKMELHQLQVNYRSHSEIVDASNNLINFNRSRIEKIMFSDKGPGGTVRIRGYNNIEREIEALVNSLSINTNRSNTAVIARTNLLLKRIEEEMIIQQVPYIRHGKKQFWEEFIPSVYIAYLELIASNQTFHLSLLLSYIDLSERTQNSIINHFNETRGLIGIDTYALNSSETIDIKDFVLHSNNAIRCKQRGDNEGAISEVASYMIKKHITEPRKINIIDICKLSLCNMRGNIKQRIQYIKSLNSSVEAKHDTVELITLHRCKGLQWHTVYLPFWVEGTIPHMQKGTASFTNLEEERRLAYVGLTRAESDLRLSYHATSIDPEECASGYEDLKAVLKEPNRITPSSFASEIFTPPWSVDHSG